MAQKQLQIWGRAPESEKNSKVVLNKCACGSPWCASCLKSKVAPRIYQKMLSKMDWKNVRDLTITVDPSKFQDAQHAFEFLRERKKVAQLIRDLVRYDGIKVKRWVSVLEWYRTGFPHWHVQIETETRGSAGRIGKKIIQKRWSYGVVWESYYRDANHWNKKVGYFGKAGYFAKGKQYQIELPEWLKDSKRRVNKITQSHEIIQKNEKEEQKIDPHKMEKTAKKRMEKKWNRLKC